jgi:hypothetical protein
MKVARFSILVFFLAALSTSADELGMLVEKVAKAYGGQAALEKAAVVREEGRVEAAMGATNPRPILRLFTRPMKLRVEVGPKEKPTEARILDGAKGWRGDKEVTGTSYQAMVLQATRLDLPLQLLLHKDRIVEKDAMEQGDKRLRLLELALEGGLKVSAGIDPDTGRILYSSGTTAAVPAATTPGTEAAGHGGATGSGGPTGPAKFETYYDDFRMVDGVLFAFKETNWAQGVKTADIVLSEIKLLKSAPPDAFRP